MSFIAILLALLIEQARPLASGNMVHTGLRAWSISVSRNFDAGKPNHAWVAWALAVLVPTFLVLGIHLLLVRWVGWPVALVWNVAVLYTTVGFRQFSHHFTRIRDALDLGDERSARESLAEWQQVSTTELPRSELVRHVLEYSVLAAHRHVFGVLTWYTVLAVFGLGPAGAVFYRMSEFVKRYWSRSSPDGIPRASAELQRVSALVWTRIDWLPARATALCFAVVGSFEEAIDGWRFYARQFPDDNDGVLLAATSGAINVRLGGAALKSRAAAAGEGEGLAFDTAMGDSDVTPGREPELAHLRSVVGLVWRSVVVWMLLLVLLSFGGLIS